MRITIYQIIPELDQDRLMFLPLSCFQKAGYQTPPAGIYESVFCGETEAATLEEIYQIFNRTDEADTRYLEKIGFTGHSLSVSDILEVQDAPGDSRFYFCDTFGFPQISFQKEHAMLPVQNHNYIPYEQIIRSKSGHLAYLDDSGLSIHPCIQVQLQRCKYSQCQLGYRLRYREKEGIPARQREFLERPVVLLFEDTLGPAPENLWYHSPKPSVWISRHPAHSPLNLKLVEEWCQSQNITYEYL
ncbi:TPA: hypothetical protein IWP50_000160 [Enterococcus faecium]|uniref:YodL domain-containing protein n=1 Tax=Merdimonas faecis TaxID=1653435 RepID=A0A9D2VZA1_9FIRM|nr:YodL domain-containing protein [Merdimonas faecis]HAP8827506.1 hypothetical protein [Enterococcus faecium]HAQ0628158.1 hypothetical protein [Enterococcus faecium]HJH50724.1 YodL domain-containing protein [Merdimonas faecis]